MDTMSTNDNDVSTLYDYIDNHYKSIYETFLFAASDDINFCMTPTIGRNLFIYNLNEIHNEQVHFYRDKPYHIVKSNNLKSIFNPYTSSTVVIPYVRGNWKPVRFMNYNRFNHSSHTQRLDLLRYNAVFLVDLVQRDKRGNDVSYYLRVSVNVDKIGNLILQKDYRLQTLLNIHQTQRYERISGSLGELIDLKLFDANHDIDSDVDEQFGGGFTFSNVPLFEYQKNNVKWMLSIENNVQNERSATATLRYKMNHPLLLGDQVYQVCQGYVYKSSVHQLSIFNKVEWKWQGGCLVDEMGLGKTLTCLTLIQKTKNKQNVDNRVITSLCNYKFKKGKMNNTFCNKPTHQGSAFCKSHKGSMLTTSRVNHTYIDELRMSTLKSFATLIVCPNQLCEHWVDECQKMTEPLKIVSISSMDHFKSATKTELIHADVVVVSTNFFSNLNYKNYVKKTCTHEPLTPSIDSIHWKRIIFDEAHELFATPSPPITQQLCADLKWVITGTPFPRGVESVLNNLLLTTDLSKRMNIDKNGFIYEQCGFDSNDFKQELCKHYRRNTKASVSDELSKNVINETVNWLTFSDPERNVYSSIVQGYGHAVHSHTKILLQLCCDPELNLDTRNLLKSCKSLDDIQRTILKYHEQKKQGLSQQKRSHDQELKRLQDLISDMNEDSEEYERARTQISIEKRHIDRLTKTIDCHHRTCTYLKNAISDIQASKEDVSCPICLDDILEGNMAFTSCGHTFCRTCIDEVLRRGNNTSKCPSCKTLLSPQSIYIVTSADSSSKTSLEQLVEQTKSTKVGNIIHFIKTKLSNNDKCIVFSQWDELLNKVSQQMKFHGLDTVFCTGTVYQKRKAVQMFKSGSTNILMLSSRHAASGLDLICANKIIFLEPIYGSETYIESVQNQAIGRADRIGQSRPIEIIRFFIRDTIEEEIYNKTIVVDGVFIES